MRSVALLIITHLALLSAPMASAQDDDVVELTFSPTLEVGNLLELKLTRSRRQSGADLRPVDSSTQTSVTCEVREKNETGFVLAWKTDWQDVTKVLRHAPFYSDKEWLKEYLEKLQMQELLIQTDELASPTDVINANEVLEMLQKMIDGMIADMPLKQDERASAEKLLSQVMSSDVLVARMMQDVNMYFMFSGGTFEIGEDYVFQSELPNPLGGEPFPADVVFKITSMDPRANEAIVHYEQETDPAPFRAFMEEFFKQAPAGDEAIAEMDNMELGITSTAVYTMNLKTGLPKHLKFQRVLRLGPGTERVDTTEIETLSVTTSR